MGRAYSIGPKQQTQDETLCDKKLFYITNFKVLKTVHASAEALA